MPRPSTLSLTARGVSSNRLSFLDQILKRTRLVPRVLDYFARPVVARRQKYAVMLPPRSRPTEQQGYLCAVAIVKNEGSYLREWLEFHRLVGIEHVFIYDNGSSDGTVSLLEPYIAKGYVTWLPWADFDTAQRVQFQAYAHALCNFGPVWRWMAFIDVDEFLFPVERESLLSVLRDYQDLPAVAVPWIMFGYSGHECRPPGPTIENFTMRAPFPTSAPALAKWKSIVDPVRVRGVRGAHLFMLDDSNTGAFDENREYVSGDQTAVRQSANVLRLNHYFTRSKEEFREKLNRGCVHGKKDFSSRSIELATLIESSLVPDRDILRFLPQLHDAMK